MGVLTRPLAGLQAARGQLFPFVPVFLSLGIGLWFLLPFEPDRAFYGLCLGVLVGAALLRWRGPEVLHPLMIAVGCVAVGLMSIGLRAHMVQAPMLAAPYYGPIQGRISDIDRSQSDAMRLTLDQVVLSGLAPQETPVTVRVSLHGPPPDTPYEPGQTVMLTARIAAPESAAEPGGFDFRRMAYFNQLGAVGYTASPVVLWMPPVGWDAAINRLRNRLSAGIQAAVPGDAGAFASGVMTGDRANISAAVVMDLRISSLAHLLAISGMNMAFLTGFVFALLRYGVALIPPIALRINARKVAAVAAFGVALFYLLLSGANVATTRAFLMVSVMLGAILLDRRAFSFRSVAISAIILLILQPESLTEPGFQLSFAATIALIAGFGPCQRWFRARGLPRWLDPPAMLVVTSLLAGFATAPFAAATFNRFTDYGLMANLLTVPVMSLLMGAGAVAALLAPLGLAAPAFWVMKVTSEWILFIAHWVAGLDGSITPIPSPGPWVMPILTLGALWVVLWPSRARFAGLLPITAALVLWAMVERPALLISSDGVLAGLMGPDGRALSSPRGAGFAAQSWLADDGDLTLPDAAALRAGFQGDKSARRFELAGFKGVLLGTKAFGQAAAECATADIVIVPTAAGAVPTPGPCLMIDAGFLSASGAVQLQPVPGGIRLIPVRSAARIWLGSGPVMQAQLLPTPASRIAQSQ